MSPTQEVPDFVRFLHGNLGWRRIGLIDDFAHALAHGLPVLDGGAHVIDDGFDGVADSIPTVIRLLGDLETHE